MWTQDSALLLLLACCIWSAEAQREKRQSIWEDPIKFKTKGKDMCNMIITGQGEYTRLKLSCQSPARSYWCEYVGMPYTCRNYNKNPRHYFVQMSWRLRKLQNACQAPRQLKPHMCRNAADDSQMVYVTGSFSRTGPDPPRTRPATQPARPRPSPTRQNNRDPPREETTPEPAPQATAPPEESKAKRMARQHCWRSLQGLCSFFIRLFHRN